MTTTHDEAVDIVHNALAHGVVGDRAAGVELLAPLMSESFGAAYALAGMLAETACFIARRDGRRVFDITVENALTGEAGTLDRFPPQHAFAARFTTAWANRDHDTAEAHFRALVHSDGADGPQLVNGLLSLYELAVIAATRIVAEHRAARGEEPTP